MGDREDLQGSRCATLTDEERARISARMDAAGEPTKGRLTLCGQSPLDSDGYLARSVGSLFETVRDPLGRYQDVPIRLDWCDHGRTTHYFVNGYHVGSTRSGSVEPQAHLRSIWSAGRTVAWAVEGARQREKTEEEQG